MRFVPEMHARLVRCFDRNAQISQDFIHVRLHGPLACIAQIVGIEIKNVIVLDIVFWRAASLQIPHRLEQAARYEPAIWQRQRIPSIENFTVISIG